MDDRREPRLQIYAAAKLTLLDSERELECVLLDISSTGVKFVSDEMLPADEVVALDVEDHLVLADVRYSEPRGEKFTIGAERIHSVDKAALPEGKTRAGQIRFLVDDYRGRIRLAIAGEAAAGKKQEGELPIPELPIAHRDQLVEAAAKRMVEQWAKESEAAGTEDALRAAIVDRVVRPVTPPTPVNQLPVSVKRGRPVWGLPFVTASAIAMMIFSGSLFWSYRHSVAANAPHAEVIANVPVKSDVPVPIAVSRTRHVEIRVSEAVWVYAIADGKEAFQKLLTKDETRPIDFAEKALVRVGNAGGVEITVDGQSIGPLGERGQIRALEITTGGHRFIPASSVVPEKN